MRTTSRRRTWWVVLLAAGVTASGLALGHARARAQARLLSLVAPDRGHVALGLAVRRLQQVGIFLQTAAHPDDEHNALHARLGLGEGFRTVLVQTTRGEGGQNEIGPELFQDLGVLRTAELLAAHRLDGAEQWFTRAIDYGYSFSPPEIYEKWGRREVVGDFVRLLRTLRPDVVLTMNIQGRGGDRAHEATAVLTREAFRAAADPAQYPEQIREGLRPWQAQKLYFTAGGSEAPARVTRVDTDVFDHLLGRTYSEIGADARSFHKCQGMPQLGPIPGLGGGRGFGPFGGRYQLVDTTIPGQMDRDETSLFDGIDTRWTGLARFAGPKPPGALVAGLQAIAEQARRAQQAFVSGDEAGTGAPILAGLAALRELRGRLPSMELDADARAEVDFRLALKEADFVDAAIAAHGLAFEALADDGLVVAGQPVRVSLVVANRGSGPVVVTELGLAGFDGRAACPAGPVAPGAVMTCTAAVRIPGDARETTPYWRDEYWNRPEPGPALNLYEPDVPFGAPFRPTPFVATVRLELGGVGVVKTVPVQYRYEKDLFTGEKRMELNVVPAFSVRVTPATAVVSAPAVSTRPVEREIHVTVTNGAKGPAEAVVALETPPGWRATPARASLAFHHEDEALTTRFVVQVPAGVRPGSYRLRAAAVAATAGAATPGVAFARGYHEIDYPHIERRQVIKPAETVLKVIPVQTTPGVRVGYIVGAGDQVPAALEQLGAVVSDIGPEELAWGDLSRYDVIMTGVRAYERRADLRAYNRRLLEYAERGGTVIVQYNKLEFNQAQYGPYPAKVSTNRVTDETAPVTILVPDHPVFTVPNRLGEDAWRGWVQERGLYFLGEKDPRYVDLVSLEDPFPDNPGVKTGALVEARVGRGRWLYVGLGLWRQLPAQVDGAYQLLANLVSLKASDGPAGGPLRSGRAAPAR
jgi:LmbE family N-acetylglucosaminyl deacetylase